MQYRASTVDLQNPVFAWSIDGAPVPGATRANQTLRLPAGTTRAGVQRTFRIDVRAADNVLEAAASTTTVGVVTRARPDV